MLTVNPRININERTLLIIPCSAKKRKCGQQKTQSNYDFKFDEFWDKPTADLIISRRNQIKNEIDCGYNEVDGEYLPAIERYLGKVYVPELKGELDKKTLPYIQNHYGKGKHPKIMILSALYGPLHPFELIQDYDLKMSKTKRIWKPIFEQIITSYITNHNINKIVMYTGTRADYFEVMLSAIKSILQSDLVERAYQYHVVNGGPGHTPICHGKLLYADISETPCAKLSKAIELRQGPDFALVEKKLIINDEQENTNTTALPHHKTQCVLKTEIPYASRSSFFENLTVLINDKKHELNKGNEIQCRLGKSGGYEVKATIEIISNYKDVFFTDWSGTDATRFSSRVKALASVLFQLGIYGMFQVAHKDGVLTIICLKLKIKEIETIKESLNTSDSAPFVFSAKTFRDKRVLTHAVNDEPGVYKWWFPECIAKKLNIPIEGCTKNREGKLLLYVGIGKSLRKRFEWHISQKHRISSIKAATISTFRHSICSLLGKTLQQDQLINEIIDQLDISFEYSESKVAALIIEDNLMAQHSLPLNIQGNNHPFIPILKKKRADCKSRSLKLINDATNSQI